MASRSSSTSSSAVNNLESTMKKLTSAIESLDKEIKKGTSGGETSGSATSLGSIFGNGKKGKKVSTASGKKNTGGNNGGMFGRYADALMKQQSAQAEFDKYKDKDYIFSNNASGRKAAQTAKANTAANLKAAKASTVAAGGQIANVAIENTMKYVTGTVRAINEIKIRNIKTDKEILSKRFALYGDAMKRASETSVKMLTGDLTEGAYSAFRDTMTFGLNKLNTSIEIYNMNRMRDLDNTITKWKGVNEVVGGAFGDAANTLTSIPNPYTAAIGTAFNTVKIALNATTELEVMKLEKEKELLDAANSLRKEANEKLFAIAESTIGHVQAIDKLLMDLNQKGHETARMLGLSASSTEAFSKQLPTISVMLSQIGKNYESYLKVTSGYVNSSGRNTLITAQNALGISSAATLYGLSDEEAGGIYGNMQVFNKSIEDGSDMMRDMYFTANKMGVSNQKFAKSLEQNLKLTQRYQFKGGVKGMMEMALWAQKMRVDMEEMDTVVGKLRTGNVEDTIKTSASLNVLGGNAALYSDPFAMLFNAYQDPKTYMENINKMISGLGTIDRKTGETRFSTAEMMRIEQIANTTGESRESLMNQARQANKTGAIKRRYGNKFGDMTDYIAQNAQWSEKKGTFVINMMGENGLAYEKTLDEVNARDKELLNNVFPSDKQDTLIEYVRRIMSVQEEQKGLEHKIQGEQAKNGYDYWMSTKDKSMSMQMYDFIVNNEMYMKNLRTGFDQLYESVKNQYLSMEQQQKVFDETGETVFEIASALSNAAFRESVAGMEELMRAVSSEQGLIEYIRNINPELAKFLEEEANKNTADNIVKELYDGKSAKKIIEENKAKGYNMSNKEVDKYYSFLGRFMKTDLLDGLGGYDRDVNTAKLALTAGIIEPRLEGSHYVFYYGKGAGSAYGQKVPLEGRGGMLKDFEGEKFGRRMNAKEIDEYNANDAIITPNGIIHTNPDDTIMALKPEGPIMQGFGESNGLVKGTAKVDVSGTIRLESNGQSINLNDPKLIREITEAVIISANRNKFGGRSEYAPGRYASFG